LVNQKSHGDWKSTLQRTQRTLLLFYKKNICFIEKNIT
jgi:hypothetical protein